MMSSILMSMAKSELEQIDLVGYRYFSFLFFCFLFFIFYLDDTVFGFWGSCMIYL